MNSARYDVIVVGVGSMGAAACYHLASRGVRVLGLEQYGSPHHMGSHGGQTRALRYAYAEHPAYVTLVQRAPEQWRRVEREVDRTLFTRTGTLILVEPGTLLSMQVCLYTNTPDENFILDFHPAHGNVVLGCVFSGHGFKFAPVVGEVLADLALQGRTTLPVDFLQLSRF